MRKKGGEEASIQSGQFLHGFAMLDMLHNLSPESCQAVIQYIMSSSAHLNHYDCLLKALLSTVQSNMCIHVYFLYA